MRLISATLFLLSLVVETSAKDKGAPRKALRGTHSKPLINAATKYLGNERGLQSKSPSSSSSRSSSGSTSSSSTKSSKSDVASATDTSDPSGSESSKGSSGSKSSSSESGKSDTASGKSDSESGKSGSGSQSGVKNKNNDDGLVKEKTNKSRCSGSKGSGGKSSSSSKKDCIANVDEIRTKMNTAVVLPDLLANDTPDEGQVLTLNGVSLPTEGVLTTLENGQMVYTPKTDFIGEDTFDYTVVDNLGNTHIGTVVVFVDPVNDSPRALDDIFNLPENSEIKIDASAILSNDFDPDGDSLEIEDCTDPSFGNIKTKGDGSITYTPNVGFVGTDRITCTIIDDNGGFDTSTITFVVNELDTDPFARDDIFVTDMGTPLTLPAPGITANDRGVEQGTLTIVDCAEPSRGTFTFDSSGSIQYIPESFFLGVVTIECTLDNGRGGQDNSRVIIAVRPPFFGNGLSTDEDVPLTVVPGDIAPGIVNSCNAPTFGTIVRNGDGTFTYTPSANFNGQDTFECTVTDPSGAVSSVMAQVNVRPVGDQPIAFPDNYSTTMDNRITFNPVDNDVDVDGDDLSLFFFTDPSNGAVSTNMDGTMTYTPNDGFIGTDSFEYTVNDGNGGVSSSIVSIVVNAPAGGINTRPDVRDDAYSGVENTPLTISAGSGLLSNDSDTDGDFLIITTFTNPKSGSIALSQDGSFIYFPDTNFVGVDQFQYVAFDGTDVSTGTVTLTITGGTSGPATALNDAYTTPQATPLTVNSPGFLSNDFNVARVVSATDPSNGSLIWNPDGSFTYVPNTFFVGTDSFTYTVVDSSGRSSTATVSISVTIRDLPSLIIPGQDFIDLTGKNATKRVSSDCKGNLGQEFTNCTGVNTVEEEESSTFIQFGK